VRRPHHSSFSLSAGSITQINPPRLAFIGSLIYASIIYHRARRARRSTHHPTTTTDPFSPATDYSGRTAPLRYSHGYGPGMEEERLELADGEMGRAGKRQLRIGGREGRREELEGEGGVYELEAGGSGRRRAELRG